ncbi:MAG: AFG1/ZapE family ATPase [Thermomicrobiales bacterium]
MPARHAARLSRIVSEASLVCIDEVVLEDPGNIMMLVTLLQQMTESETSVIATANMPPEEAEQSRRLATFERELALLSSTFDVVSIEGLDREDEETTEPQQSETRTVRPCEPRGRNCSAIYETPIRCTMRAGSNRSPILVDGAIGLPGDRDEALRFVRFIDRVYDRDVASNVQCPHPTPAELVSPLDGDPRYVCAHCPGQVAPYPATTLTQSVSP